LEISLQIFRITGKFLLTFLGSIGVCGWVSSIARARTEYAVAQKVRCTDCHVTPWGGGPRTVFGKMFGSRNHLPSPLSSSDIYYGDLRFIGYYPTSNQGNQGRDGFALMEAAASANLVIQDAKKEKHWAPAEAERSQRKPGKAKPDVSSGEIQTQVSPVKGKESANQEGSAVELRLLASYQIAPLGGASVREAYLRWQFGEATFGRSLLTFLAGRFYVPFGLLTDEHRTYTRIQTNMTLNQFPVGVALSYVTPSLWQFDLACVNDFQSFGNFSQIGLSVGMVGNVRWNPRRLPFTLGTSVNWQRAVGGPYPYAFSWSGILSLDRLTKNALGGSVSIERVDGFHWNSDRVNTGLIHPGLSQFFLGSSNSPYFVTVSDQSSVGYYGLVKVHLSPSVDLQYKFDFLALDRTQLSDAFVRHGFGVELFLGSNLILLSRWEKATEGPTNLVAPVTLAAQDVFFVLFRAWI